MIIKLSKETQWTFIKKREKTIRNRWEENDDVIVEYTYALEIL